MANQYWTGKEVAKWLRLTREVADDVDVFAVVVIL